MSEETKNDSSSADGPRIDSGHGDVLAEKRRLARRRFLTGTAAAAAVLASGTRAHAIGASVCFSGGPTPARFVGVSQGNVLDKLPDGQLLALFKLKCGPPTPNN